MLKLSIYFYYLYLKQIIRDMVYFIESSRYFKVGFATDWEVRIKEYFTHNPDFKLIKLWEDAPRSTETAVHRKLKDINHYGEWSRKFKGYKSEIISTIDSIEDSRVNSLTDFNSSDYIETMRKLSGAEFICKLPDDYVKLWFLLISFMQYLNGKVDNPSVFNYAVIREQLGESLEEFQLKLEYFESLRALKILDEDCIQIDFRFYNKNTYCL